MKTDENQGGQTKNLWPFAPNFLQKYLPTLILNRAGAPGVYRPMYATCVLYRIHCVSKKRGVEFFQPLHQNLMFTDFENSFTVGNSNLFTK